MESPYSQLSLLIVEDSLQMRRMLHSMLSQVGVAQVYEAKDGTEALRFLGEFDEMVDVVLCDWNMPRMTGIDLLRQVRTVDPDLPFIMITGLADEESVMAAKSLGVTSYMIKPFSQAQLEKRLKAMSRLIFARKNLAGDVMLPD